MMLCSAFIFCTLNTHLHVLQLFVWCSLKYHSFFSISNLLYQPYTTRMTYTIRLILSCRQRSYKREWWLITLCVRLSWLSFVAYEDCICFPQWMNISKFEAVFSNICSLVWLQLFIVFTWLSQSLACSLTIHKSYACFIEDKPPSQKIRRADTNVIAVNFEKLVKPSSLHANRPIYCVNCGAVFSRLSSVSDQVGEWG